MDLSFEIENEIKEAQNMKTNIETVQKYHEILVKICDFCEITDKVLINLEIITHDLSEIAKKYHVLGEVQDFDLILINNHF